MRQINVQSARSGARPPWGPGRGHAPWHGGDPDARSQAGPDDATTRPNADGGAIFRRFGVAPTVVKRRQDLVHEGQPVEHVHLLCDGVVSRFRVLPDGRRQLLTFALPGDVVGFPCCALPRAALTACCLTAVTVITVQVAVFAAALGTDVALASHLAWRSARDALVAGERLVAAGRRTAEERIAYLVLELGGLLGQGERFEFPLTQELVADATGLSTPHVNRVLADLRGRGLLAINGRRIDILDRKRLGLLASFDPTLFALRTTPLPPPS